MVSSFPLYQSAFSSSCGAPEGRELKHSLQQEGRRSVPSPRCPTTVFAESGHWHNANFSMGFSYQFIYSECLPEVGEEQWTAQSQRCPEVALTQTQHA